jgi:hypothetical protein
VVSWSASTCSGQRWRQQLEELLTRILATLESHHGIARVPLANVPKGPNATALADRMIALLRAGASTTAASPGS